MEALEGPRVRRAGSLGPAAFQKRELGGSSQDSSRSSRSPEIIRLASRGWRLPGTLTRSHLRRILGCTKKDGIVLSWNAAGAASCWREWELTMQGTNHKTGSPCSQPRAPRPAQRLVGRLAPFSCMARYVVHPKGRKVRITRGIVKRKATRALGWWILVGGCLPENSRFLAAGTSRA